MITNKKNILLAVFLGGFLASTTFVVLVQTHSTVTKIYAQKLESLASVNLKKITGSNTRYSFVADAKPSRLVIPKINVNAAIQAVGLKNDGTMDVAHSYSDVGWYKFGPKPGELGNAVIEGHLDTKISPYAVFFSLDQLSPGDEVQVIDNKNRTIKFKVINVKVYPYNESPNEVFAQSNKSFLNLITCTGKWDPLKHNYSERLVVFTRRVDEI